MEKPISVIYVPAVVITLLDIQWGKIGIFLLMFMTQLSFIFTKRIISKIFLFRCDFCQENDKQRCYHWEVGDEASLEVFRQKLEEHLTLYVSRNGMHYSDVRRNTKIVYDPTDELRFSNPYNIEYRPQGDTAATVVEAQRFFSNLVTTELRLGEDCLSTATLKRGYEIGKTTYSRAEN